MSSLKLISHVIVDIDGKPYQMGSLTQAKSVVLGSDLVYESVHSVGPETQVKIFDEDQDLADFDFLLIESDLTVQLFFGTDSVSEYFRIELLGSGVANEYGVPFILGSDYAQFLGLGDDVIHDIYAYNADAEDTARVHIFAAT